MPDETYIPQVFVRSQEQVDKEGLVERDLSRPRFMVRPIPEAPVAPVAWKKTFEEMTSWERDEFKFAGKHPNLYALVKTSLEFFPYAKYLSPEEQQNFLGLDKQEQTNALLHEALFAALWGACGPVSKGSVLLKMGVPQRSGISGLWWGVKKGAKLPFQIVKSLEREATKKGIKVIRVEDAFRRLAIFTDKADFKGFEFGKFTRKALKKEGFHKKEIDLLINPLQKGEGVLSRTDHFIVSEMARRKYKFSKVFEENVPILPGKLFMREMDKGFASLHSEPLMEASFRKATFEGVLRELFGGKEFKQLPKDFSLKIFQERAKKLYPAIGKTFNFGEASTTQMANISLSLLEKPIRGMRLVMPGEGSFMFPTLLPTRVVYGLGQKVLSTMDKIYKPIKKALAERNRNYFNHILLWSHILKQEGLYTSVKLKASGEFVIKKAEFFTAEVSEKVFKVLTKMDDLTRQAGKATTREARKALLGQAQRLPGETFKRNDPAILMFNAWRTYSDHLYSEFIKKHFNRTLGKIKAGKLLPDDIVTSLEKQSRYLEYEIDNLFSTVNQATYGWKMGSTKRILGRTQRTILRRADKLSKEELIGRKRIASLFQYGTRRGFPAYLENYTARFKAGQLNLVAKWRNELATTRTAAFRHPRKADPGDLVWDFSSMIQSRTMAQASELYLYDSLGEVVKFAKRLPPAWRDYIDAHISGLLGLPSTLDHKVAWFLTKSVGGLERTLLGKSGIIDESRVIRLGHTINTLTYLAALGFKPFSAIRNLFQTTTHLPADLGGIKDIGTMVTGMKKALDPKVRKQLIDWGAITEFAPEIHLRPAALPFGKRLFGVDLPSLQRVQDAGLWMFKGADRVNRYVSGGAALRKWEVSLEKVGGKVHSGNLKKFSEHLRLAGRRDYAQDDVIQAILRGDVKEAQKVYVLDVIADTQYLYGLADAPIIIRKHGALARTGFIFQSWWMNYGTLLEKWIRSGEPLPHKVERMFTAMTSMAIAGSLMSAMWGTATAVRTVGMGPFPKEANEYMIPPAWKFIYHALATIANVQTPDVSSRHAKAILPAMGMYVPGYLQVKAQWKGAREEGFEGFMRAIIRLKKPEPKARGFF